LRAPFAPLGSGAHSAPRQRRGFLLILLRVRLCCGLRWVVAAQAAASFNKYLKNYERPLVLATKIILVKENFY